MTSLLNGVDLELIALAMASLPEEWQVEGRALEKKIRTYIAKGELQNLETPPAGVICNCERRFHMSIASFASDY